MRVGFAGAIGLLLAAQVRAQDGSEVVSNRTPASAQAFLIGRQPSKLKVSTNIVQIDSQSSRSTPVYYQPLSISSQDACATDFTVRRADGTTGKLTVDWRLVDDVKEGETSDGTTVTFEASLVMPRSDPPNLSLSYPVSDIAQRVIAAARYLQQACDKTAETGF